MNKNLLTLALAGALALPVASQAQDDGATWYGSIRTSLGYNDADARIDTEGNAIASGDSLNVNDHSSRIGVKGANDLGNGLKVPYRFEFKADSDEAQGIESGRLGRVGLQGGFGAIHIGQLWGPYYTYLGQYIDLFNSVGFGLYQGNFRISNALRYDIPTSGGFSGQVAVIADGAEGEDTFDGYHLGFGYNTDTIGVAIAYIGDRVNDDADRLGVTVGTSFAGFDIGLLWEDNEKSLSADEALRQGGSAGDERDDAIFVVASYGIGANTFRVGYSDFGNEDAMQLGWQHKLGKASRVAIEFETSDSENGGEDDLNFFIRTDF